MMGCSKKSDTNTDIKAVYKVGNILQKVLLHSQPVEWNYSIPMKSVEIITTLTNQILINAQDTTIAG